MVRIFRDGSSYMVQTTCLEVGDFVKQLAEALAAIEASNEVDTALAMAAVLDLAMPIAFKLAGYKADNVNEQRTLVCGVVSPAESKMVATSGL